MNKQLFFIIENIKKFKFNSIIIRTFLMIILSLLIPVTIFNGILYSNNINATKKDFEAIHNYNLSSSIANFETTIREAENFSIQTSLHSDIYDFVLSSATDSYFRDYQKTAIDYIKQFVYVHKHIHSVYVFSENSKTIISNNNFYDYRDFEDNGWYSIYENMKADETVIVSRKYAGRYPKFISIIRAINVSNKLKTGCVVVNIDVEQVRKKIYNTEEHENIAQFFVTNEKNCIIYSNVFSMIGENASQIKTLKNEGEEYLYSEKEAEKYKWKYSYFMSAESLVTAKKNMQLQMLLSVLILAIVAMVISAFISMRLFEPFNNIIKTLSGSSDADDEIRPKLKQNEISLIIDNIKKTKGKNVQYEIELQYRMIALNKAQALALQAQINPHFFNNMLEIINWTAIDLLGKNNKISTMLKAMSRLLTISLDFENYLISIKEEIQHINVYSYLIGLGFEEQFNLIWDFDPDIENYKILKLTLQPIVENAIYHGVGNDVPIEIRIKGEIVEDGILFVISDNGTGIEPEKLKEIQKSLKENDLFQFKKHIGLNNVDKRIKLICSERYGVSIDSVMGEGTTVRILIPKITDE